MNVRCYRCGWSFNLGREAIEAAVTAAGKNKLHVEYCPKCRQAIKIPVAQLRRALPPNWKPAEAQQAEATTGQSSAPAQPAPKAIEPETQAAPRRKRGIAQASEPASEAESAPETASRSKKSAAEQPAVTKSTRKQSKP